jgi:2,5-furandicarboxylate decarboxylase 1
MGAILDPSNPAGATAKLLIDATAKKRPYAKRHSLPPDLVAAARQLERRFG